MVNMYIQMELRVDILSNVLEVKVSIVTRDETGKCDQKFRKRWMHINKILALNILRRKLSEVYFVEPVWNTLKSINGSR
jgi:hypothetical protein